MNDEIKEMLECLKTVNDNGCVWPLYEKEAKILLDYITNLQEENKELNDDNIWWSNRFKAVERDNRDCKSRNEKAIEYIENNKLCICKEDEGMIFTAFVDKELLNILQGSDKE